ncbi:MAG: potassium-transporting ATPase subunit KdpA [Geobacteraceae bacterium]
MSSFEWLQAVLFFVVLLALIKPFGTYMAKVFQGERTFLSPVLVPCENILCRICGIDRELEMDWKKYARSMLFCNGAGLIFLFVLLLLQGFLPLNPQKVPAFSWHLALNTATSFTTNTNWQNYSGEASAGYFVQMFGFAVQNFLSSATGIVIAIAVIRGLVRRRTSALGNFWVDTTRCVLYLLLPFSLLAALFLVSQGVIQNFSPPKRVPLVQATSYVKPRLDATGNLLTDAEGNTLKETITVKDVTIPMGPVASQEAIKEFGTNGGGFLNANSSHPFENPTPLTNFLEMLLMLLIPGGLTYTFGRMAGNTRQGWALLAVMLAILVPAFGVLYHAEGNGNPLVATLGVHGANMEGKEVRFSAGTSALFTVATTGTSCGAVNSMHDSLTPIGGMVPLSLILLGEVAPGGVGTGLYTMLAFVIIAVFVAGLMIGRTPEYLGKKIEVREMWLSITAVLTSGILVLVFTAVAVILPAGISAMANPGAHGLSEVLYAFASMANNNGSAFAGLSGNTLFYNLLGAFAMFLGRFVPAVAVLAMAGALAEKQCVPPSPGTLPTDQVPFAAWLTLVILVVGALTFFPALAMGPIAEQLTMVR